MSHNAQILCLGAAAVLDTVLLLAVLERRNRRYVLTPVLLLILGGWLWHVSAFCYALLMSAHSQWTAGPTVVAMSGMATGLLLMPSAMLHGLWRIRSSGLAVLTTPRPRYLLAYLPVLTVIPIAWRMASFPGDVPFLDRVWPFVPAYTGWLFTVNFACAAGFLLLRRVAQSLGARHFFTGMAAVLVALIALHAGVFLIALPTWPELRPLWLLIVMLSPVLPAIVFAYYVLRYDFMQVVVERSLVYAAILTAGVLLHETAVRPVTAQLSGRFGVNFAIIEALLVIGLIVLYQPLRQRTSEALRYLMGDRVGPMRDQTRQMAVRLSELADRPTDELLAWFCPALREALQVRLVSVWLDDGVGSAPRTAPSNAAEAVRNADPTRIDADAISPGDLRHFAESLRHAGVPMMTPRDAPDRDGLDRLRSAGLSLVVRLHHQQIDGLLIVGRRGVSRDLTDEQANAAVLLAEQLAITLNQRILQADRLAAERRALQAEKLGMLGLVASSIAHEVKNPLSSIKTIVTVMAEDLPPDHPHRQDLSLIRDEIDRLSATTSRLLKFARPAGSGAANGNGDQPRATVADALSGTLAIMEHLARQKQVTIDRQIAADLPSVAAEDDALREIFTNLIANAIECGGDQVTVSATADDGAVRVEVADNGPGLPDAVRSRLFEPFVTTRQHGTGLGLYIVGRRVKEMGGEICVEAQDDGGTRFVVRLPPTPSPGTPGEGRGEGMKEP